MSGNQEVRLRDLNRTGRTAVVIGGSMAGLLAARVLSEHFDQVTILEKDPVEDLPQTRRGQPQARHAHGLLGHGLEILEAFFPGLTDELVAGGAIAADMGEAIRWYQYGGYRRQFHSGLTGIVLSRPFLEWRIRRRVLGLPNVTIQAGMRVECLIPNRDIDRITELQVRDGQSGNALRGLVADLFVDASGRGSRTPSWLTELGYPRPAREEVRVDVGYASRIYRRRPDDRLVGELVMILPSPPNDKRMAFLLPMEHDRWIVTAGGWHGQPLPTDGRALMRFLRDLQVPDIFQVVKDAEPLSDIVTHKFPSSRRLRFERLARFPDGYLVIGDALASFTPVYAQGMTAAAMQARALAGLLQNRRCLAGMWRSYFNEMANVVDDIWQLAVSEDFRFPETRGNKRPATDLLNWYVGRVHRATHRDTVVYGQFLRVMNLLVPASSLMQPRILARVLYDSLRQWGSAPSGSQGRMKSMTDVARS